MGVTIRQLLLHLNCTSEFEAPRHAGASPSESLFSVPNDELYPRLRLVGDQVFLCCQITVAVSVSVKIRVTIRHICKKLPLVVVREESTLFLLHGVHLKTNSQMYNHIY